MGKYKDLSHILINSMYNKLCEILRSVKVNPTKEGMCYFELCLYEFIVAVVCVKYKKDLSSIDKNKEIYGLQIISKDSHGVLQYTIDGRVLNKIFAKHYSKREVKSLNKVISILSSNANILRHNFGIGDTSMYKIINTILLDDFVCLVDLFLSDYSEVKLFLLDKELLERIKTEFKVSLYNACVCEFESFMFNHRYCSLGEAKQYLINRNICSESYAEHFINEYLKDYIIVTDEK